MTDPENLPYRPCAGIMLANKNGKVFAAQRLDNPGVDAWQMPQGGIDPGEDPRQAALRELFEETGIAAEKVTVLAQSSEELFYDLPPELVGKIWKGKWRGQRQWWFLMRFLGKDSDINIDTDHPEFSEWKWADAESLPEVIVPFKKELYRAVLKEFRDLI
ncbi:RNA pyrophosphohydrolase [Sphingorhabdus sp. Alg239-R122]|uniref:RNA pyrophosphohydrolase n=1 Tax=Sphingorhabdus sp. Alg239-R122 TaxID=2305989 RepID=UPI0013DAFAEA|nr:RNA pyrophosphohydrolase [Sphingorhabdus sp. Alg239-R122]